MSKIARFIIWICSKFTKSEVEQIVSGLIEVLADRNPEVKPKDDFKEKHPNYRDFAVPPLPPLTELPKKELGLVKDYKQLLAEYETMHGMSLAPVRYRKGSVRVPELLVCPCCNAPHTYLYYNDGKKRSQLLCKICGELFQAGRRFQKKTKYYCPYCLHALFTWKVRKEVTIYKCSNDTCEYRVRQTAKLNEKERELAKRRSSQFKLCYQYREYHYQLHELTPTGPEPQVLSLPRAHNGPNVIGLVLAFYVSFALSARKTAVVLKSVFGISISYQSVLNYAAAAAFYCHSFNLQQKGSIDEISAGDEAYIKVMGKQHYVFFFISSRNLKITAYHVADSRETLPAIIAMREAVRTAAPGQTVILVTDGNPSYPAGIHFLNAQREKNLIHRKVIGLQNLDSESEAYRPYKQLIERLNRTFKHHIKPSHGFNSVNGAVALVTLFVTHYNFLRPHTSLNWRVPMPLPELEGIATIQGKWAKILSLAA
jgi:transposase-like protein/transcription elongation factor Elf1